MIKLDASFVTTTQSTLGETITSQVVTDTLFVSFVSIDFQAGTVSASILRGTSGSNFVQNMSPVLVTVQSDGSFTSQDGSWRGTITNFAAFFSQLVPTFDNFILASGQVTGTAV